MTNNQVIALWDSFLKVYCNCYPDANGNRPCDNGAACDKCLTPKAREKFNSALDAGITVTQAARKKQTFVKCPTGDLSCPYCNQGGICMLENPREECDDYYAAVGDEEEGE